MNLRTPAQFTAALDSGEVHIVSAARVESNVITQFVVDKEGKPEPATFRVFKSPNDFFSSAVVEVLPNFRYKPATISGRPVRQLVQQAFLFRLDRTKADQPPVAPQAKQR